MSEDTPAQNPEQRNPVKAEVPEKLKIEKVEFKEIKEIKVEGKAEIKEKPEKIEFKEHKLEGKFELKELKVEAKIEVKEHLKELKPEVEGPLSPVSPVQVDRQALLGYAAALEKAGQDLRHFIEQGERPDLTHGALRNEPGEHDEPQAGS